jgi:hypothetical protein
MPLESPEPRRSTPHRGVAALREMLDRLVAGAHEVAFAVGEVFEDHRRGRRLAFAGN